MRVPKVPPGKAGIVSPGKAGIASPGLAGLVLSGKAAKARRSSAPGEVSAGISDPAYQDSGGCAVNASDPSTQRATWRRPSGPVSRTTLCLLVLRCRNAPPR